MKLKCTPNHKSDSGRVVWLDYAKVFGMLLVIIGHLPFSLNFAISLFHMPLFFMLSGYLYKRRCVKDNLAKSFKALIIPYLFFNCIIGFVHTLVYCDNPCELLRYIILSEQEQLPYSFRAMWFLTSLFTMRIISSFVGRVSLPFSILLFASCCIYKHINGLDYITEDPFQITSTLLCYVFFELGRYLKNVKNNRRYEYMLLKIKACDARIIIPAYTMIIIVMVLYVRLTHMREVNLFRSFYGDNIIVFLVISLAISLIFMHTTSIVFKQRNMVIEELSNGMIFILCTHQLIITIFNEFFKFNNLSSILFAFLFMCLSIFPIRILRKHIPFALGR